MWAVCLQGYFMLNFVIMICSCLIYKGNKIFLLLIIIVQLGIKEHERIITFAGEVIKRLRQFQRNKQCLFEDEPDVL